MFNAQTIVSLNLFGILPCLIMMIGARRISSPLSRLFIWLAFFNAIGLLTEACAWIFEGNTSIVSYYAVRITDFLNHVAGYAKVPVFGEYLYICLRQRTSISRKPFLFAWCSFAVSLVLLMISLFNHMYVYFDELNVYHTQEMYFVSQVLPGLNTAVLLVVILYYYKYMTRGQVYGLYCYFTLLFVSSITLVFVSSNLVLHYIFGTAGLLILFTSIQMDEVQQRERELAEGRTAVMLSQIGPHFLFNVLTDISQLCSLDPKQAQQATIHFSRYLRANVDSLTGRQTIPFATELEHVKHYLWLESMGFGERLRVDLNITVQNFRLPALTLQPLVENAVRHGIAKREEGGCVTVKTEETQSAWRIIVSDDGIGFNANDVTAGDDAHVGIVNVRYRLKAMCGGSLTITSTPGTGTVAVIEIPK